MQINTNTIQITLSKTQLNSVLTEALADEQASLAIKRILSPFLSNSFPQFPEHTAVTLGETNEVGTIVSLKIPAARRVVTPEFEAAEPEVDHVAPDDEPTEIEDA